MIVSVANFELLLASPGLVKCVCKPSLPNSSQGCLSPLNARLQGLKGKQCSVK